jgi:hypothetical protein
MIVSSGYRKNGFDAACGRVLRKEDMSYWMNDRKRTDPSGVALELGDEVEEVEAGFFELLPTIDCLWIKNPNCNLYLTEEDAALFRKNDVIVRGEFDTAAERFAKKYGLRFLHLDTKLAHAGNYFERGVDIISLCFYYDGTAYIHQDCRCQGISAGNTGGGEVDLDLPDDFYLTMTAEDIAAECWGSCYEKMISNGVLATLLKKAKRKKGFLLDFRPKEKEAE